MNAVAATALWLLEKVCVSEVIEGFTLLERVAWRACIIAAICGQRCQCVSLPDCSKLLAVTDGLILQCMLSTHSAGDILLVPIWMALLESKLSAS